MFIHRFLWIMWIKPVKTPVFLFVNVDNLWGILWKNGPIT